MKITTIAVLILLVSSNLFGQEISVKGQTVSSQDNNLLAGATVQLFSLPDSALISGDITNTQGRFTIPAARPGKYYITVTYIGYKKYSVNADVRRRGADLGRIALEPTGVEREAIEIIGRVPPAAQKSDTSEYNANAYKISKDAVAEDLVAKMPGIVVQDGKYQAHGEDIKKVLVDGRPFLGDDPSAVLKNIPAEVIEKIQVFDQQSEQAQFSGFDDGNTNKTINIVTRPSFRDGTFGKLSAGYGDDERYRAGGTLNIFDDSRRITLLTQLNNVNEQNFAMEDLVGIMSGGGGRRGGGMGRRDFGGDRGPGGGGAGNQGPRGTSDFLVDTKNGLSTTKAFGLNFADRWGAQLEMNGSYFFNQSNNNANSLTSRSYVIESLNQQGYSENSIADSRNINHRLSLRMDYRIDTLNSVTFTPKFSYQKNDGSSYLYGETFLLAGTAGNSTMNSVTNNFNSNLEGLNTSGELLFRHRFAVPGRTLSVNASGSYKKNTGDNALSSQTYYYDNPVYADTADQISDLYKDGYNVSASVVYTEPVSSHAQLQLNTRMGYSEESSDQKTYLIDSLGAVLYPDSSLSNKYDKIYKTQSAGAGYRYQNEGISLNAGLSYNMSQLDNSESFPSSVNTGRRFYSVLPSFMLRYNISRDKNLRMFYRTSNKEPGVEQLQNVLDNSNTLQLSTGNPLLKQDYSHSLSIRYSAVDFARMNSFFIMLGGTYTNDYIGNSTLVAARDTVTGDGISLAKGTQLTRPENMDGYINVRSFSAYSLPVNFISSNLNLMVNVSYSRTPGMVNGQKSFTHSNVYGGGVVLSSNVSEFLDFTVSTNSSFSNIRSSRSSSGNSNYFNQNSRFKLNWEFWKGFFVQTDVTHQYDDGLSSQYNRNSVLWNMSLGKKLFSRNQGEIRFTVNDMLEQNSNIQRTSNDLYYEDTRSNVLGRYFLVSFTYNVRAF